MFDESSSRVSPQQLFSVLFRHKKKLFGCFFGAILAAAAAAVFCPNNFESEAKLFVRVGRESVTLDPTATIGESTFTTLIERLRSSRRRVPLQ